MNKVFIATSIDGYIADKEGGIDWLHNIPNPEGDDMGYSNFMKGIDAILMGRVTYETVLGFGIEWPYAVPVFVLSNSLKAVPDELISKVEIVSGNLNNIIKELHSKGLENIYIDGGSTIQSFLKEDLIDEMTITHIPVLLGGGTPLFGELAEPLEWQCVDSKIYLGCVVQNTFRRPQRSSGS
jgi:dihydrofolate reductase